MLKTNKSVLLTGTVEIDGQQAVYLNANITTETAGNTSANQSITNDALYKANLRQCRADITAFTDLLWAEEDRIIAESEAAKE